MSPEAPGVSYSLSAIRLSQCLVPQFKIYSLGTRRGLGNRHPSHFSQSKGHGGRALSGEGQGQGQGVAGPMDLEARTLPSKTETLAPQFCSPFLILPQRGEVDHRVPLVCPNFWYKLPLAFDLAVESLFLTPLPPCLDLPKCQPPRLVRTPRSSPTPHLHPGVSRSTDTCTPLPVHTHSAHVHTHSPFDAGRSQARVCLETQDWYLPSPEEPRAPSRGHLPSAGPLAGGTFAVVTPIPGPDAHTVSSPSRAPGLGTLPPRVHGLSTHTSPNLAVLSPMPQLGLLWEGQEESAQRRGDSGLLLGSCRTADNPVL
ncbi:uncharacterized protein [Sagmatias obliquidens]|uniref:uncharacterized protein n=1 Tax=Sagmatias obliquidens TaxID=3371155 RepID=UPI000F440DCC|nr:uncharacterized protein LOC113628581 [Lagenorhynchus obliquidens]